MGCPSCSAVERIWSALRFPPAFSFLPLTVRRETPKETLAQTLCTKTIHESIKNELYHLTISLWTVPLLQSTNHLCLCHVGHKVQPLIKYL